MRMAWFGFSSSSALFGDVKVYELPDGLNSPSDCCGMSWCCFYRRNDTQVLRMSWKQRWKWLFRWIVCFDLDDGGGDIVECLG